ncbi:MULTISPECIES: type II secretion system F family protein [Massilia]|jgi:general secretion pathway protein F|uniref:Type II secretion system F family protein n=2 Tax=Massilia TaxID=149698 RepID=A0A7X3FYC1_9BURK|nr:MULTISPECIES: type II secretion system F family protein [Telluria group]KQY11652.1 type II secretion system protein [Massilia sp. Root133]KQZ46481.1 type II secretion system protein [Massilia sp. Root1485]MDN4046008.1 type II secretion system F family protein [Massilia sp. YIM B02787]MVW60163.1 type II secretion system F family protein [Telluria cellulosilytica]
MQFAVRTLAPDMRIASVLVDALDEADARRQVEARGLFVSAIEPVQAPLLRRQRGGKLSLVLFSQELLALLTAGLGIVEGLEALLEKETSPATRSVLERLLAGLREGKRLSAVMAAQPALFPPLYVGIVRAAEGTSDLPRALERYIEYQQRIDTVRAKVVSASIYPAILLLVGGGVSIFLMSYVVPRFAEVYQGAGRNLPWMSRLMLDWGQFAGRHAGGLFIGFAAFVALAAWAIRRALKQGGAARLLARLPGIGERARIYELSRLYLTLGMLNEGGITLVNAIDTVQGMVSPGIAGGLKAARAAIEAGRPMSDAFEANGLTTPISLRMLRVGERTGSMGTMLTRSAAFYDGEIGRWIDRFTRTFEPLLMAAIGLVVGAIVVLLYMPIFDLAGDMS